MDQSPQRKTDPQPQASAAHVHPERILFLDDDLLLSTLGHRFLTKLGYDVVAETSPARAIERLKEGKFDLVFTDLTMPNISGLDVARECKSIHPQVPVILMTGYNPTTDDEELRSQGISDVILKPYGIQALSDAVRAAFAKGTSKRS